MSKTLNSCLMSKGQISIGIHFDKILVEENLAIFGCLIYGRLCDQCFTYISPSNSLNNLDKYILPVPF